ncbi:hypothetical protein RO3G_03655 [Rhizopus delemar RA 99-880]|uniref:guanosine-diphosphatase n=1 Tax=Rhizopus delemar (strain RA 99-880 / ATCC MYA-4621 / FGSC 9543 / NRRL 43880) TaxID=246409 RepID=I1BRX0_RHIO9|nr:hypothetical protein RO3G_03655 [Rhizopus delemar RA 99-880]|eukprot:EIE78950.1 hypothetical protein RO3G_03655 [Rhizopus delemar RA 99-880]
MSILFIQPTHTGHVLQGSYNGDLGDFYSFTVRMKQKAKKLKKDLFIVDTGDTHDGDGLSDVTDPRGEVTQPLITNIPYDILTIGNHELYVDNITTDTVRHFVPHWNGRYLAANVYFKDLQTNKTTQIGNKYTYFKGEFGTRVLAYGFLFNFAGNGNNSVVNYVEDEIAKPWFNQSLKAHTPDIITIIGHIGIRYDEFKAILKAVRAHHPTIPIAVLGGHTDFTVYDGRAAGIESGRYMETIGFFSVDGISKSSGNLTFNRRYLDQNRATYIYHSVDGKEKKFDTTKGKKMSSKIYKLREKLQLSQHLGCAPQDYPLYSVPVTNSSSLYHLVTHEVLPKTVADTSRKNTAFFLYNGGGLRYDIFKGPFTESNVYQISPFEDNFYCIYDVPLSTARKVLPILNHEGDDTPHSAIPFYDSPAYVGSDLPTNVDDSTLIDIVYLDFFDNQLRGILKNLTGTSWTANTTYSPYTNLMSNKKQPKLKTPYAHLRDAAAANREKSLNSIRLVFALLGIITAIIFYRKPDIINTLTSKPTITSCQKYALMVDAGSTGSRIHVYRFHQCNRHDPVRLEEEELFAQTQPGLSAFANEPQKAAESLDGLMQDALRLVPSRLQKTTPIAVKATAGLRLLGEAKSEAILEAVRDHLATYPFRVMDVSMMDGKDEGVYAWITVNFLLGHFADNSQHSAAVLDLGGGSTQIVFEPDRLPDGSLPSLPETDSKYILHFDGKDYLLYQNSYLGYGLMEARKRMHQQVMAIQPEGNMHACLPRGLLWEYSKEVSQPVLFNGTGSFTDCVNVADMMLNKDKECELAPCSFDGIYQPPISDSFKHGPIYIFSYFHDRTQPLGLPATFRLPELEALTESICSGAFLDNVTDVALKEEILDRPEWCLDLSFIYRLLSYGYEIPHDRLLTVAKKIDNVETGWCLGAAIAILGELEHTQ